MALVKIDLYFFKDESHIEFYTHFVIITQVKWPSNSYCLRYSQILGKFIVF